MGWSRASHFSHVSASPPGWLGRAAQVKCASCNGGWHGVAGWGGFRRFPEAGPGLRADDGGNSLSHAGSPLAVTDLRLAELRSVSEIPCAQGFSAFWQQKLDGPLYSVTVAHSKLIKPAELRAVD